jgi:hypothetical protein
MDRAKRAPSESGASRERVASLRALGVRARNHRAAWCRKEAGTLPPPLCCYDGQHQKPSTTSHISGHGA